MLNRDSPDFIRSDADLDLLPGVADAAAQLCRAGLVLILVTNQSGIARGLLTHGDLTRIHRRLVAELAQAGAVLTGIYYCPHGPNEGCACRKPLPGMLRAATKEHGLASTGNFMVGDRPGDIECGRAAGCTTILVLTGKTVQYNPTEFDVQPNMVAADLTAAAHWILQQLAKDLPAP